MNGGQGRNRTSDTRIFSAVLYQLSYLAPETNGEYITGLFRPQVLGFSKEQQK
jgi:hypothetical protein